MTNTNTKMSASILLRFAAALFCTIAWLGSGLAVVSAQAGAL